MEKRQYKSELTLVVGVSGQPFAFGAAGGANDADCVPALHRQVVLADLASHHHLGVIHGLLFASHLERRISAMRVLSCMTPSREITALNNFELLLLTVIVIPLQLLKCRMSLFVEKKRLFFIFYFYIYKQVNQ